jgi:type I restriction enzyme R subunit
VDSSKAKAYFEALETKSLPAFKVKIKAASLLQRFVLEGGFEPPSTNPTAGDPSDAE